jgi:hypothetical protein
VGTPLAADIPAPVSIVIRDADRSLCAISAMGLVCMFLPPERHNFISTEKMIAPANFLQSIDSEFFIG